MEIYLFMLFLCSHYMMLVSFPSPKRQLVLIALKVCITQMKLHPQQTNESCSLPLSSSGMSCIRLYSELSVEWTVDLFWKYCIPISSDPFQFV